MTRSSPPLAARRPTRGEPVGHEQAVPAPLPLDDAVVDGVLLGGRHAVDVVVRRHDRPGVGVLDGDLEGQQVELAQRRLVDDAVDRVPLRLGLVGDEVLEAGADPVALQAVHVRRREPSREEWIFRVRLEESAPERRSVQVDGRAEDDVDALPLGLFGEHLADLASQVLVPGGGDEGGVGQQRHRATADELQTAHPGRPVGEGHWPSPIDSSSWRVNIVAPVSSRTLLSRSRRRCGRRGDVVSHGISLSGQRVAWWCLPAVHSTASSPGTRIVAATPSGR